MKNVTNRKKEVIDDYREFKAFSAVMTHDAFFAKYTLSPRLIAELGARKALANIAVTDRALNSTERFLFAAGQL